ncbi:MAG: Sir2 family NAD-dependent protein deacetylase, partial [bacterium]
MHPIRQLLAGAKRVVALTGAGISAESGIPTFRGSGGLWKQYRAEDLATPEASARNPRLVWEWYDWRRGLIAAAEPNAGHKALVELKERTARDALAGGRKRSCPAALCAMFTEERTARDALASGRKRSRPAALCAMFTGGAYASFNTGCFPRFHR